MFQAEQFELPPPRPVKRKSAPKFFEFLIIDKITNESHAERAFCEDEEQAHSYIRLTWSVERFDVKSVNLWNIFVKCKKCNRQRVIASGYNSQELTSARKLESMRRMGWTYETGVYLCRSCSCPMNDAEISQWKHFSEPLNHRNDNGKIECNVFIRHLNTIYESWQIERYTQSLDEFEAGKPFAQS